VGGQRHGEPAHDGGAQKVAARQQTAPAVAVAEGADGERGGGVEDVAQGGEERGELGGTCLNTGCTPTKTMIASALESLEPSLGGAVARLTLGACAFKGESNGTDTAPPAPSLALFRRFSPSFVINPNHSFQSRSHAPTWEGSWVSTSGRGRAARALAVLAFDSDTLGSSKGSTSRTWPAPV